MYGLNPVEPWPLPWCSANRNSQCLVPVTLFFRCIALAKTAVACLAALQAADVVDVGHRSLGVHYGGYWWYHTPHPLRAVHDGVEVWRWVVRSPFVVYHSFLCLPGLQHSCGPVKVSCTRGVGCGVWLAVSPAAAALWGGGGDGGAAVHGKGASSTHSRGCPIPAGERPPTTQEHWQEEFDKYRASPEFK